MNKRVGEVGGVSAKTAMDYLAAAMEPAAGPGAKLADSADMFAGSLAIPSSKNGETGQKSKNDGTDEFVIPHHHRTYRTRWVAWSVLLLSWGGSLSALILRGGELEAFMLAVLSVIMIIGAGGPLLGAAGLEAGREIMARKVRDGGETTVRLTIRRSFPIPLVWYAVGENLVNRTGNKGMEFRYIAAPLFRKELTIDYSLHNVRRGEHVFRELTVTTGDWLGMTAITRQISCPGELLALPALPEAGTMRVDPEGGIVVERGAGEGIAGIEGVPGTTASRHKKRMPGVGPESRPYRQGDSPRHIDWRAAAKGRGLYTKQHTAEQPAELAVIVDTSAAAYGGDGRLFDACAAWAAQAIERAAAAGGAVRLLAAQDAAAGDAGGSSGAGDAGERSARVDAVAVLQGSPEALQDRLARLRLVGGDSKPDGGLYRQELGGLRPGGKLHAYTADWKEGKGWTQLAALANDQGCRLELHIVTKQAVLTYAMREQQRLLETYGIQMHWLPFPERMMELPYTAEGGVSNGR
ncbi:DUF58 domain-containing protein [Paenibacillus radicis (ex Gao et al. 2016)]|uniref:DUF58 domain-containing protein n=1 Tax=Paenibacillus radicis (ex Gao et al. 2016) TaxID=1737354 RepID=A0A917HGY8_9BACL|nr:DUF58 domain-containing protein [Paenibacillus radicis (ex Gao et al. 2016)]GGG78194.1 hypothetical protein GCM10010918_38850 [Paenibacillus radicis (ex Gao et al. 2016)]